MTHTGIARCCLHSNQLLGVGEQGVAIDVMGEVAIFTQCSAAVGRVVHAGSAPASLDVCVVLSTGQQ